MRLSKVIANLTCDLISILVADELQKAFGDIDEDHFLLLLFLRQARIQRLREGIDTKDRFTALVAVFVENGVEVAVRLCFFCEVENVLDLFK